MKRVLCLGSVVLFGSFVFGQASVDSVTNNLNALSSQIYIILGLILLLVAIGIAVKIFWKRGGKKGGGSIVETVKPAEEVSPTTSEYAIPSSPQQTQSQPTPSQPQQDTTQT